MGKTSTIAFHPIGVDKLSSKLIQMCANLLVRRHLVNAYEMNAGWLIPFLDKRVGGNVFRGTSGCVTWSAVRWGNDFGQQET